MSNWNKVHEENYASASWIKKNNLFAEDTIVFIKAHSDVLDLGGGQGQDSKYFSEKGCHVTLLDGSSSAIEHAKKRLYDKDVEYIQFDLHEEKLPFADESFDLVYAHLSLHYFNERKTKELFTDIFRILRKNGIIALVCNTVEDEEIKELQSIKIEKNFYKLDGGFEKRYFSVQDMKSYTENLFEDIVCDDRGRTVKDGDKGLIRYIGEKV